MTDQTEPTAVPFVRRTYRELVDGTLAVTIHIQPMHRKAFLNLFPDIDTDGAMAPLTEAAAQKAHKPAWKQEAAALYKSAFFRTPEVWRAIGSDDEYREWVQRQPSCLSGKYSEHLNGEGRCEAAHVLRANLPPDPKNSEHDRKPAYSCVPLTHEEHHLQHQFGELHVVNIYRPEINDRESAKSFFDKQRIKHVHQWAWEWLKLMMGREHWYEVEPVELYRWAVTHGLEKYLPPEYREAGEGEGETK